VGLEQHGNEKTHAAASFFDRLSKDLTLAYDNAFGLSNLFYMSKLYLTFQKCGTLFHKLI
jgi:hypothetical protein